jgi:diguanylate cyclase (GGDEF)-like protein
MIAIMTSITYILIGVCAYASLTHARIGIQRHSDKMNLTFSAMCAVGVVSGLTHRNLLLAVTQQEFGHILPISIFISGLLNLLMLRFVSLYTKSGNTKTLGFSYALGSLAVCFAFLSIGNIEAFSPDMHLRDVAIYNYIAASPTGVLTPEYLMFKAIMLFIILVQMFYLVKYYLIKQDHTSGILLFCLSWYFAGQMIDVFAYGMYLDLPLIGPLVYLSSLAFISFTLDYENVLTNWKGAYFDGLTGLPNRARVYNILEDVVAAGRSTSLVGLLFVDLDRFKEVNDAHGHQAGDRLLVEAAARMKTCVRNTDCVGRLGGDEFVVVIYNIANPEDAGLVASNVLKVLSEGFKLGADTAYVSASIGITVHPKDAVDIPTLFKNADQAMYEAKKSGRNRYCYYDSAMQETSLKRTRIISDFHSALANREFFLQYQPIVDLSTGKIVKAEALVRWAHPRYGKISPAEFIPVAEDTGLILELGDFIFNEAIRQCAAWRRINPEFKMSVNVSAVQFRSLDKHQLKIQETLDQFGLPGDALVIEITESTIMVNNEPVADKLDSLQASGIEIALDDFGTGYSSLAYLKKFPIDYIKIDQSFVRSLHEGSPDMSVCEAITVMAHKLGLKVIAEGVETNLQGKLLKSIDCDFGQGYYFSRPVDSASFPISAVSEVAYPDFSTN